MTDLVLDLPWLRPVQQIDGLKVRRDRTSALRYDDGIELAVQIVDPTEFDEPVP